MTDAQFISGLKYIFRRKSLKAITFVLGGCRSGKSRHALELAKTLPGNRKVFIATCVPCDDEMEERVARHQKERDKDWKTVEVPALLPEAVLEYSPQADVILIDCLTFWLSNLLLELDDTEEIIKRIDSLIQSLKQVTCPVILVSNEVGTGIVPENKLARQFRDLVGTSNQKVAACADKVIWMVAGVPSAIK